MSFNHKYIVKIRYWSEYTISVLPLARLRVIIVHPFNLNETGIQVFLYFAKPGEDMDTYVRLGFVLGLVERCV